MARKNLLKGLMEPPSTRSAGLETKAVPRRPAGPASGAIGAVSQTIADLKARAVIDLDTDKIRAGGFLDRVEDDDVTDTALREQIREYGQQVPILVRPHPTEEDAYQIVYGRRRALACRDLGIPVKAMIRDLDDRDLIVAQGQENTARRDLTFIEKANFARQMVEAGYKRKTVCDALSIDKTVISRMLSVAERVPLKAIYVIGAAPGIGRDRWLQLADLIEETETTENEAAVLAYGKSSDERFEGLMHALTLPRRRRAEAEAARRKADALPPALAPRSPKDLISDYDGRRLAEIRRTGGRMVVKLEDGPGFGEWLARNMHRLHDEWQADRD